MVTMEIYNRFFISEISKIFYCRNESNFFSHKYVNSFRCPQVGGFGCWYWSLCNGPDPAETCLPIWVGLHFTDQSKKLEKRNCFCPICFSAIVTLSQTNLLTSLIRRTNRCWTSFVFSSFLYYCDCFPGRFQLNVVLLLNHLRYKYDIFMVQQLSHSQQWPLSTTRGRQCNVIQFVSR